MLDTMPSPMPIGADRDESARTNDVEAGAAQAAFPVRSGDRVAWFRR